jgi:hypothetical protein
MIPEQRVQDNLNSIFLVTLRYHRWYRGSSYDLYNESCGHSEFASNVRPGGLIQRFLQADI